MSTQMHINIDSQFSVLASDKTSGNAVMLQGNYVSCQTERCPATEGRTTKIKLQTKYANEDVYGHLCSRQQHDTDDDNIGPNDNIIVDAAQ